MPKVFPIIIPQTKEDTRKELDEIKKSMNIE